jgi:integrase
VGHAAFGPQSQKGLTMPSRDRFTTKYPGAYYVMGTSISSGKPERIYRIRYRKDGKTIEETAGRQYQHNMSAAKAARMRAQRIEGDQQTNSELREEQAAQKEAEENRWTFDRLWDAYKEATPLKGLVYDENRYDKHIRPTFGDKEPKELIPLDLDRVRIKLLKKLKPQTVKHILALMRRLINFGINKQLCEGPGFAMTMPKVDNRKTEDLSPDQLQDLLAVLEKSKNIQVANLMRMALYTGMRRGELFGLKWNDVDFDRGFILIRHPKGGRSQKIPLNETVKTLLHNHPRQKSPYVFPGKNGKRRTDITHSVNKIKKDAGLPADFRALHGLRHVYASSLASSGKVDMYTLQKLLTHKDPATTQRYAHLRDEALRQASDLVEELFMQPEEAQKINDPEKQAG